MQAEIANNPTGAVERDNNGRRSADPAEDKESLPEKREHRLYERHNAKASARSISRY